MPLFDLGAAFSIAFNYFTIIYLTGLGGLFSERSGIVNIGLEGMMIVGTVVGRLGNRRARGRSSGCSSGAAAGLLFSLVHAVATVTFRVDHIVSGVVINLVAIGLARFLAQLFFGQSTQSDPGIPRPRRPSTSRCSSRIPLGLRSGVREHVAGGARRVRSDDPGRLRAEPDPVRAAAALRGREPRGRANASEFASRPCATRAWRSPGRWRGSPARSWPSRSTSCSARGRRRDWGSSPSPR